MIEGFAREMPEDRMLEALDECHRIIRILCEMQDELVAKAGKPKKDYVLADYSALTERLTREYYADLKAAKRDRRQAGSRARGRRPSRRRPMAAVAPTEPAFGYKPGDAGGISEADFNHVWHDLEEKAVRELHPRRHASRRPRPRVAAGHPLRGRRAAASPRLGPLSARRDPGAGHHHARHRQGRAAGRRADRRVLQEVHARLLLPLVLGGRSAADSWAGPSRDRSRCAGRAEREAGAARSGRVPLHDPRDLRHSRVERLELDGERLRRDPRPDGRRRADQPSGGRHLGRPRQGERRSLDAPHRHHRRRGSLRRHGLQDRRHAKRHHRHPARPQDRRHLAGDHRGDARRSPARPGSRSSGRCSRRSVGRVRRSRSGRRGCCARRSTPRRSAS